MPPRKPRSKGSARAKAVDPSIPQPVPLPKDPESPSPPRSPIQAVYEIPELFQRILHFVSRHDLTRVIRVEKALIPFVAAELYRKVDFRLDKRVQSPMSISPARDAIYRDAIRTIEAYNMPLNPAWQKAIGYRAKGSKHEPDAYSQEQSVIKWLQVYRTETMDKLLPILRSTFPLVREVHFGEIHGCYDQPQWSVYFHPRTSQIYSGGSSETTGMEGHIEYYTVAKYAASADPPTSAPPPPQAPRGYTIGTRFDINLREEWGDRAPAKQTAWLRALREEPCFADVYKEIILGTLPFTLDDMIAVIRRQIAAGHTNRLSTVSGRCPAPFTIEEFGRFARIAGSSISRLEFSWHQDSRPQRAKLHFADLPTLVQNIRTHLPNLSWLTVDMNGIATGEAECKKSLHGGLLSSMGTRLWKIQIFGGSEPCPALYNILRCLYPICGPRVNISIYNAHAREIGWGIDSQSKFIRYLQKQSPRRRFHLSTVDFEDLDIVNPKDVLELEYDGEDRPIRRWVEKSTKWQGVIQEAEGLVTVAQQTLEKGLKEMGDLTAQIKTMGLGEREADKERQVTEKLLEVVRVMSAAAQQVSGNLSAGLEKDLASYLRVPGRIRDEDKKVVRDKEENWDSYEDSDYY